jgi:hypothetical protein
MRNLFTKCERYYISCHGRQTEKTPSGYLINQLDSGYIFGKDERGFYVRKTIDAKDRLEVVGIEEDYTKRAAFGNKRDFIWDL